jgi:trimethylamine:corrinoid methyltransferase-like protein
LIFGAAPGLLDMKQTTFAFAAPEVALASAVCVEIGHELGLACMAPSQSTDAKHPGVQAAYEKMLKGFTVTATRPDLMTGIGMLHAANLASLPQAVIDDEMAQAILRILDGPESRRPVQLAMMERMGFAANYLMEKDTSRRLRAGEVFSPGRRPPVVRALGGGGPGRARGRDRPRARDHSPPPATARPCSTTPSAPSSRPAWPREATEA